jgi:hypothetical protein
MSDCSENNINFIKIRFKVFEKIIEFKIWNIEDVDNWRFGNERPSKS